MRTIPDPATSERQTLNQYLDYQRETIMLKAEGLDRRQLARKLPDSDLTLAGLLYHLAYVEESWMEEQFHGASLRDPWRYVDWDAEPDWEFRHAVTLAPETVRQRYRDACDRSRAVMAQADSLDQLSALPFDGKSFSLRWVLLHLIEETARHAGHADLLREAIDGTTGE